MEIEAIANIAEDLIRKCRFALDDPKAEKASLQELIGECAAVLTQMVAEQRALRETMRNQIQEIAALVASQEAVWPEEVARLEALRRDIQRRAALFSER